MRVRLLIDVMWPEEKVTELGELAAAQTPTWVEVNSPHVGGEGTPVSLGGRLVGAEPVEAAKVDG